MNSYYHAKSSAKKWGGTLEDYLPIHEFIDSSKSTHGDFRHRALYHHTLGVWLCQQIFGTTIEVTGPMGGKVVEVPVRLIAERHIIEDLGYIPSPGDYLKNMAMAAWMSGSVRKEVPVSHFLGQVESGGEL